MKWRGRAVWSIVILSLGLVLFGAWLIAGNLSNRRTPVTIGAAVIQVRLARTDAELTRGLSGVGQLDPNTGMLFVFDRDGPQPMWMKDMKISLDMVWLSSAKKVVYIERNLSPDSYPKVYKSPVPARYVLEIPAGSADQSSVTIGTPASFDIG